MFSSKRGSARITTALSGFESTIAQLQQGAVEAVIDAERKVAHSARITDIQVKAAAWVIAQLTKLEALVTLYSAKRVAEAAKYKADAKRAQLAAKRLSAAIGGI